MAAGSRPPSLLFLLVVSLLGAGCAATTSSERLAADPSVVVQRYFAAVNRRDLSVLPAWLDPDVEWYSLAGGERILEVAGRDSLAEAWSSYFARFAQTSVAIEKLVASDDIVVVVERAEWRQGEDAGSRRSIGVFELENGRIRRISYFLPRS